MHKEICVFDWDQIQLGWFLYDLAQPLWGVIMLAVGGNPLDSGKTRVPEADPKRYEEWLVEAYEKEMGEKVDRTALGRMVDLRKELYSRFCHQALAELPPDSPMAQFCSFVVSFFDH